LKYDFTRGIVSRDEGTADVKPTSHAQSFDIYRMCHQ